MMPMSQSSTSSFGLSSRASAVPRNAEKDGISRLLRQHDEVKEMFGAFKSEQRPDMKKAYADKIVKALANHSSNEMRYVYPLIRDRLPNGQMEYKRAIVDEDVHAELLDLVEKLSPEHGDLFDRTVLRVEKVILDHVDIEEEWLAELHHKLTQKELEDLDNDLAAGEKSGPTHAHPTQTSYIWGSMGVKLKHPLGGAIDKARDAVLGRPADKVEKPNA